MEEAIYRMRLRDVLALCAAGLLALGAIMVQSASMRMRGTLGWNWTDLGIKQIGYACLALLTFWFVGKWDYARLARPRISRNPLVWLMIMSAVLCLIVLIPHVGTEHNGARRWLSLKIVEFQPSELAKWASVSFLAWWLTYAPVNLNSFFRGFLPTLLPIAAVALLVVIQDFGTAALILLCGAAMCLAGRVRVRHLLIVFPPIMAAGFWFVHHKAYRWRRITAFLDPYSAPQKEGYHMIQSLLSFSTGGLLGRGLGNGIQKMGYLPEDTTDFIYAVICEELGLFGAILTIALYLGIVYVGWRIIRQRRDDFGRLLAFGVTTMIAMQAIINIAVATVCAPTKGLSLPLVSAGGSGLIITCAALGLVYSVDRFRHEATDEIHPRLEVDSLDWTLAL